MLWNGPVGLVEVDESLFDSPQIDGDLFELGHNHGQLVSLEARALLLDDRGEVLRFSEHRVLRALVSLLDDLGLDRSDVGSGVLDLALRHGEVAHLGEGLEEGEELKVLLEVGGVGQLGHDDTFALLVADDVPHNGLDIGGVHLAVVGLADVLGQLIYAGEEGRAGLTVADLGVTHDELGHRVEHEGDNRVGVVIFVVGLDSLQVFLVDGFHFLGLGFGEAAAGLQEVADLLLERYLLGGDVLPLFFDFNAVSIVAGLSIADFVNLVLHVIDPGHEVVADLGDGLLVLGKLLLVVLQVFVVGLGLLQDEVHEELLGVLALNVVHFLVLGKAEVGAQLL